MDRRRLSNPFAGLRLWCPLEMLGALIIFIFYTFQKKILLMALLLKGFQSFKLVPFHPFCAIIIQLRL